MSNNQASRNRGGWTKKSLDYLEQVKETINRLKSYWPLTLRQIYYQLVAALVIENCLAQYQRLSRILTKARLEDMVPWSAMEDRSRSRLASDGWADAKDFIDYELDQFLFGYCRNLLASQAIVPEVWVEKDALSRIAHKVALEYCVPVVVARGFSSVSFLNDFRDRVLANEENGQRTRVLYFGDLDPSGWAMLPAMMVTLQQEMGLGDLVSSQRCALTPEQVTEYNLPRSIDAMKDTDSRTPGFKAMLREGGHPDDLAVELDALPPAVLEQLVREAIETNLDMDLVREEQQEEGEEYVRLRELRTKVRRYVKRVA